MRIYSKNTFLKSILFPIFLIGSVSYSQTIYNFEYLIGKTSASNSYFPSLNPNQTLSFSIGKRFSEAELNWARNLNHPVVGINLEYSNFGNNEILGSSYSLQPFIEMPILKSTVKNMNLHTAIGVSYFTKKYDVADNWQNKGISTDATWAFRMFLYYKLFTGSTFNTRLSTGYTHKSNGHTKWPNNGLNTFLIGLNLEFNNQNALSISAEEKPERAKRVNYFSVETGFGKQALSRLYNTAKNVYTTGFSRGWIYDKTFKVGFGAYYRFYQGYYDYIKAEGEFINDTYPELKKNIVYNSSTYGVNANFEVLMNHIGVIAEVGFNIDKPFYKVDYRINNEEYVNGEYFSGDINTKYWIKRFVSGKMGLKYYLWNTKKQPKNNLSIGALICSNLGQADYSELNIGFIHLLN